MRESRLVLRHESSPVIHTGHLWISKLWAAPGELTGNPPLFAVVGMSQNKEIKGVFAEIIAAWWFRVLFLSLEQHLRSRRDIAAHAAVWARPRVLSAFSREPLSHREQDPTSQHNHHTHCSIKESACTPTLFFHNPKYQEHICRLMNALILCGL